MIFLESRNPRDHGASGFIAAIIAAGIDCWSIH
jgi:hypothetical protein